MLGCSINAKTFGGDKGLVLKMSRGGVGRTRILLAFLQFYRSKSRLLGVGRVALAGRLPLPFGPDCFLIDIELQLLSGRHPFSWNPISDESSQPWI
jgi:hypothetical protein